MLGAYGQHVVVQPDSKTVVVITSVDKRADEANPERASFISAIFKALGSNELLARDSGSSKKP
jgi:hypothetical protein